MWDLVTIINMNAPPKLLSTNAEEELKAGLEYKFRTFLSKDGAFSHFKDELKNAGVLYGAIIDKMVNSYLGHKGVYRDIISFAFNWDKSLYGESYWRQIAFGWYVESK